MRTPKECQEHPKGSKQFYQAYEVLMVSDVAEDSFEMFFSTLIDSIRYPNVQGIKNTKSLSRNLEKNMSRLPLFFLITLSAVVGCFGLF